MGGMSVESVYVGGSVGVENVCVRGSVSPKCASQASYLGGSGRECGLEVETEEVLFSFEKDVLEPVLP